MTLLGRVDERIAAKHLLTHPFYLAWTAGTLPRASLVDYARQYFAFEVKLPRFLTAMHARTDDGRARAALLANAWDEEHGENNHAAMWLEFAEALGLSRGAVVDAEPNEATCALVDTYWAAATEAPLEGGVAALYAYESQLPAVSESKIDGLVRHYDVYGRGLMFFSVHRAIDLEHSAVEREIIASAPAEKSETIVEWTSRALDAWWSFLDMFPTA